MSSNTQEAFNTIELEPLVQKRLEVFLEKLDRQDVRERLNALSPDNLETTIPEYRRLNEQQRRKVQQQIEQRLTLWLRQCGVDTHQEASMQEQRQQQSWQLQWRQRSSLLGYLGFNGVLFTSVALAIGWGLMGWEPKDSVFGLYATGWVLSIVLCWGGPAITRYWATHKKSSTNTEQWMTEESHRRGVSYDQLRLGMLVLEKREEFQSAMKHENISAKHNEHC